MMRQIYQQVNTAIAREIAPYLWIFIIAGIFWIWALIDVLKSDFENPNNKTIWILLLIFAAPAGIIFYALIGIAQKKDNNIRRKNRRLRTWQNTRTSQKRRSTETK